MDYEDYYGILNKNVIKILEVLKKEKLYFNQIYEQTGIKSKNNLLKNLNLMADLKILKKEKAKGNTFYNINYENNMVLILLQLINTLNFQKLPFERRKAVEELINETKPILAILFGSTAKGNFKKQSDIDILIVYNERIKEIDKKVKEISSRYGLKINPIIIKFSELDTRDEAIKHILITGYPVTGYRYFYMRLLNIF